VEIKYPYANMTLPIVPEFQVRNLISFRITDPYINFDKWRLMYLLDDDYRVTGGIPIFMSGTIPVPI